MNISRSFDAVENHATSVAGRAFVGAQAVAARIADAVAAWRNSRPIRPPAPAALDSRTLRDIGLTPMGISEEALAALNEAGRRRGGRS